MRDERNSRRYSQWISMIGKYRLTQEIENLLFITENSMMFSDRAVESANTKLTQIRKEQLN